MNPFSYPMTIVQINIFDEPQNIFPQPQSQTPNNHNLRPQAGRDALLVMGRVMGKDVKSGRVSE